MGWETDKLSRTLIIQKHAVAGGKFKYAIHPFMRIATPEGVTYMEPTPEKLTGTTDVFNIDKIEFIDGTPGTDRESSAGDLNLTSSNSRGVRRAGTVV